MNINKKRLIGILEIDKEYKDAPSFPVNLDEMKGIIFNDDGTYAIGNLGKTHKITDIETYNFEYLGVINKDLLAKIKIEIVAPNEEYEPDACIYITSDQESIKFVKDNSLSKDKPESFRYTHDAENDKRAYIYKKIINTGKVLEYNYSELEKLINNLKFIDFPDKVNILNKLNSVLQAMNFFDNYYLENGDESLFNVYFYYDELYKYFNL